MNALADLRRALDADLDTLRTAVRAFCALPSEEVVAVADELIDLAVAEGRALRAEAPDGDHVHLHRRNLVLEAMAPLAPQPAGCAAIARRLADFDDGTLAMLPYQSPRWSFDDDHASAWCLRAVEERPNVPEQSGSLRFVVTQMFADRPTLPARLALVDACLRKALVPKSSDAGALVNALAPHLKTRTKGGVSAPALPLTNEQLDLLEVRAAECAETSAYAFCAHALRVHGRPRWFDDVFDRGRGSEAARCWMALYVVEHLSLKTERAVVLRALELLEALATAASAADVRARASYAALSNEKRVRKSTKKSSSRP